MSDTKALVEAARLAAARPGDCGKSSTAKLLLDMAATIERLEAKAEAFNDMTALLANGYHSFEWNYDSDAETLTLLCYDEIVELAYPDNQENGTEKTLAEMKKKTGS